jgi:hypothetical protein
MSLDVREIHEISQTWIAMQRLPESSQERNTKFWAFERLSDLVQENPEEAWNVIEAMRRLDGADSILANIAAGPLEDLLVRHGDKFIDRFDPGAGRSTISETARRGVAEQHVRQLVGSDKNNCCAVVVTSCLSFESIIT